MQILSVDININGLGPLNLILFVLLLKVVIVCLKYRPVSLLTARVIILYPGFFLTKCGVGAGGTCCLTKLVRHTFWKGWDG